MKRSTDMDSEFIKAERARDKRLLIVLGGWILFVLVCLWMVIGD